ncbi:MAG TPA: Bax inhibitor-1/YccA family protein [Pirellulales bacterium]|nr:Bax inhibitor-1/YccA family protein [Pirellulales bacterium]
MSSNLSGAMDSRAIALENAHFMSRVYAWMTSGILVTFGIAYGVNQVPALARLGNQYPLLLLGLFLAQLGIVFYLSAAIKTMRSTTAMATYMFYAGLVGLTFSVIFQAYTEDSIASVFLLTGCCFGGLSAFGYITKVDLGPVGSFCTMGLFGIIGFWLVSMFFPSMRANGSLQQGISIFGVLIFAGLTAYDTQKIKALNIIGNSGTDEDTKEAIFGALTLYLDFINLFLFLLRLFGRRRN